MCRWCYEHTAHIRTLWHPYCLNAYRVASGQHPDEMQHTLCKMCGEPSDEMDHRLEIEVARALGSAVMLRAFTPDNLRWLCRSCHRRRTGDWRSSCRLVHWTGIALGGCSGKTAGGRCRFCCRAAWSLLRGRQARADGGLRVRSPNSSGCRCALCNK